MTTHACSKCGESPAFAIEGPQGDTFAACVRCMKERLHLATEADVERNRPPTPEKGHIYYLGDWV